MKKLIELTPEWVLKNLTNSIYADGYGIMTVFTNSVDNANWIMLALNTLKIQFEESEYGNWDDLTMCYQFKIEDIKDDCPSLFNEMKNLNEHNLDFKLNRGIGLN